MKRLSILMLFCCFYVKNVEQGKLFEGSVFETDLCNVTCPDKSIHTMCSEIKREPCKHFKLTTFEKGTESEPLMRLIVDGHNGLRSRVADKMNVPNMLELTWDKKLAIMAENFLKNCFEKTTDSCAAWPDTVKEEDAFVGFYKSNFSHAQIVQNIFSEKGAYYPYKFIERVMRSWYFEKEGMRQPLYANYSDGIEYGRLMGENNFTHFASPLTFRFGCGMASYFDSYHLVCNYYPYYRTSTNVLFFSIGPPVTNCPAKFPMMDDMYTSLCTADTDSYFEDGSFSNFHINVGALFSSILLWFSFFVANCKNI